MRHLPFVVSLLGAPIDEACPAVQGGQLKRKIVLSEFRRNTERVEMGQESFLRRCRQGLNLPAAVSDSAGRPFVDRQGFPGGIKPFLPVRHGPGGMALIQKGFTPFDESAINLPAKLRIKRLVAPGGKG